MKKNTCGTHCCPPAPPSDRAKTTHVNCFPGNITVPTVGTRAKLPLILAFVPVRIAVEANVCLPHAAKDIKAIRKNLHLTQCKVIPLPQLGGSGEQPPTQAPAQLYIAGYVHKNIQFTDGISPFVRDHAVNIPFECTLELAGLDITPTLSDKNVLGDSQYIELANNGMEGNRCITGGQTFEFFNEPIECELDRANIYEMDFLEDFDSFGRFRRLREKITINLELTLTQLTARGITTTAP